MTRMCQCSPTCTFPAAPGEPYAFAHDKRPERQLARSEEMRRRGRGERGKVDLARYTSDPLSYFPEVLGVELTAIQTSMVLAIWRNPRAALSCGQRTGRTLVLAGMILWFADCHPRALSLLSTPSQAHMRGTIWRQILELIRRNPELAKRCDANELPTHGVSFKNGSLILGIASDSGARLQGYAASGGVRIFGDEMQGYPPSLIDSLMSNVAGGGEVVLGGNPLNNTSYYAARWRTAGWKCLNISSLDVARSPDRKPGQATLEWCEEIRQEFGEDSILYRARVLGLFSAANINGVFTLTELDSAQTLYDTLMANPRAFVEAGPLEMGVDVARSEGRDATCVVARRGNIALAPQIWRVRDLVVVAEKVAEYARSLCVAGEDAVVKVDGVGVGAGVVDVLSRSPGVSVVEVQAAGSPARDAYTNIRSEAVFLCRDWLRAGGCFARDPHLEGEMAALTYCFDQRNKLKIRSKDELRRELGRSTDRFDALALATYWTRPKVGAELYDQIDLDF